MTSSLKSKVFYASNSNIAHDEDILIVIRDDIGDVPSLGVMIYTVLLQNTDKCYFIDIIINRIYFYYFLTMITLIVWD